VQARSDVRNELLVLAAAGQHMDLGLAAGAVPVNSHQISEAVVIPIRLSSTNGQSEDGSRQSEDGSRGYKGKSSPTHDELLEAKPYLSGNRRHRADRFSSLNHRARSGSGLLLRAFLLRTVI
jgi:hypothetical protein